MDVGYCREKLEPFVSVEIKVGAIDRCMSICSPMVFWASRLCEQNSSAWHILSWTTSALFGLQMHGIDGLRSYPEFIFSLKVGRYNPDRIYLIEVLELVHQLRHCIKELPGCLANQVQLIKDLKEAIPSDAKWDQLATFVHSDHSRIFAVSKTRRNTA